MQIIKTMCFNSEKLPGILWKVHIKWCMGSNIFTEYSCYMIFVETSYFHTYLLPLIKSIFQSIYIMLKCHVHSYIHRFVELSCLLTNMRILKYETWLQIFQHQVKYLVFYLKLEQFGMSIIKIMCAGTRRPGLKVIQSSRVCSAHISKASAIPYVQSPSLIKENSGSVNCF